MITIQKQTVETYGQGVVKIAKGYFVGRDGRVYKEHMDILEEIEVESDILEVGGVKYSIIESVCRAFLEIPDDLVGIERIGGAKDNFDVRNFKYKYIGRQKQTVGSNLCKLNELDVSEIKKCFNRGYVTTKKEFGEPFNCTEEQRKQIAIEREQYEKNKDKIVIRELSDKFGVSIVTIKRILNGKSWSWVK